MALNDPPKTLGSRVDFRGAECGSGESEHEEEELENLEPDVKKMAQKILEYRATLPDQLKDTFASILSGQRPVLPGFVSLSEPGSSEKASHPDNESDSTMPMEEEKKASEKIHLLKDKISRNMSAMPTVLKRVKECVSRIDELESYSGTIHPAFKKKRPS